MDRLRSRGMPEFVGTADAPVPVVARIALGVALREDHGGLDVAALVRDPHVELEIGPVARQVVDDLLEVGGQGHGRSVPEPLRTIGSMATTAQSPVEHGHRVLTGGAGFLERPDRSHLTIRGPDAHEYLQGQVTNDIEALAPGAGCYAALLNPKGRMLADMRVLAMSPEELWLDLEQVAHETALRELTMYKIGRKVEISDGEGERTVLSVIGPRAWEVLERAAIVEGSAPAPEHTWVRGRDEAVVVATDTGFDLLVTRAAARPLTDALTAAGAEPVSAEAAELVRIEQGRPRFGVDMGEENLPGEAGIVARAVSFTKGCYVGQEPVARMFHKGHPNRHLRTLLLSAPVDVGTPVMTADKEVGKVTSAGVSPVHGAIALAILRREVAPGDEVTAGSSTARVLEPPA